eukprot:scaffold224913_cov36-Tisochrysis_lutea.AAC.1
MISGRCRCADARRVMSGQPRERFTSASREDTVADGRTRCDKTRATVLKLPASRMCSMSNCALCGACSNSSLLGATICSAAAGSTRCFRSRKRYGWHTAGAAWRLSPHCALSGSLWRSSACTIGFTIPLSVLPKPPSVTERRTPLSRHSASLLGLCASLNAAASAASEAMTGSCASGCAG